MARIYGGEAGILCSEQHGGPTVQVLEQEVHPTNNGSLSDDNNAKFFILTISDGVHLMTAAAQLPRQVAIAPARPVQAQELHHV